MKVPILYCTVAVVKYSSPAHRTQGQGRSKVGAEPVTWNGELVSV